MNETSSPGFFYRLNPLRVKNNLHVFDPDKKCKKIDPAFLISQDLLTRLNESYPLKRSPGYRKRKDSLLLMVKKPVRRIFCTLFVAMAGLVLARVVDPVMAQQGWG